jgi:hypothetical protein
MQFWTPYTASSAFAQAGTQRPEPVNLAEHRIHRKQILGGLTHEYYVAAWLSAGHHLEWCFRAPTGQQRDSERVVPLGNSVLCRELGFCCGISGVAGTIVVGSGR